MMKYLFALIIGMASLELLAQNDDNILKVFDDQVTAFNERNVDGMMENISQDFKWYYLTSDTLLLEVEGKQNFRKSMEGYFNTFSSVHSSIESYVVTENHISFVETVSYINGSGESAESSSMGVYEIKNGVITRVWYFLD